MKKKYENLCYFCIILLGIFIIFIPTLLDLYNTKKYDDLKSDWLLNQSDTDYSSFWLKANKYNNDLNLKNNQFLVTEEEQKYVEEELNPFGNGQIGFIEIEKLSVILPIYYGTEENVLQSGSGLLWGSSIPTGKDNTHSVITAHNGLVKAKMFTDLDKLNKDDEFVVSILDKEFICKVKYKNAVEPENFDVISLKEGKKYISLYTCTPYGLNTHRLVVTGEIINTVE